MMKKLGLIEERMAEEAALCEAAPEARPLLDRLGEIYDELRLANEISEALGAMGGIYLGSSLLGTLRFFTFMNWLNKSQCSRVGAQSLNRSSPDIPILTNVSNCT